MNGYQQIRCWMTGFTYKADWEFDLSDAIFGQLSIGVTFRTADSCVDGPSRIRVGMRIEVPPFFEYEVTKQEFFRWLHRQLVDFEAHEALEWMKLNGRHIFDPHPDGTSTNRAERYLLEPRALR